MSTKRRASKALRLLIILIAAAAVISSYLAAHPDALDRLPGRTGASPSTTGPARQATDAAPGTWTATTRAKIDRHKLAGLDIETTLVAPHPYVRAEFGPAWSDTDHNGCDTRNDVLARDLISAQRRGGTRGCVIEQGTLADPYSGRTILWTKGDRPAKGMSCATYTGATPAGGIDIDHVIPLGLAWRSGAWEWTPAQRLAYANDPAVLVAVDSKLNQCKSDQPISQWMPPNPAARCQYGAAYVDIADRYGLSISRDDLVVLTKLATDCEKL